MKICINLCSIQTEFKKLLKAVISEVNHHRCLPFNPTQILPLKSNAAPIMSLIWSLARLLWLVYDHKVSIICANVPILSTAADYCWWFMIILGFVYRYCWDKQSRQTDVEPCHYLQGLHSSDWLNLQCQNPGCCFDLEQNMSFMSYALQRPCLDLWVASSCLQHWKMANQHINDCAIEGAKKNINPQVHYINWNHPRHGRQWLQAD